MSAHALEHYTQVKSVWVDLRSLQSIWHSACARWIRLLALARRVPDRRHLHVPGEPFARRDAARGARTYLAAVRGRVGRARRARLARRLVGDRRARPATCWRRSSACARGHDHDAPERDGRAVDRRVVLLVRRPAPQDRAAGPRLPDEPLSLRGLPPLRRARSSTCRRTTRCARRSIGFVDAIDERTALVPISLVLFRSGCLQDVRPVVEKAHRVGARVVLDIYQAAGTVPMNLDGARRRLRRRRLGEVAVRRSGRRAISTCGPDLDHGRCSRRSSAGRATRRRSGSRPAPIRYADGIERFQSGTPNVPSLYSARAGYEIVAEIGVPAIRAKSLRADAPADGRGRARAAGG